MFQWGQVTEESLLLNHPSSATASDPTFRLSMVHVWLPLANPDGLLVQNNWAIPYLRAGMEPPESPEAGVEVVAAVPVDDDHAAHRHGSDQARSIAFRPETSQRTAVSRPRGLPRAPRRGASSLWLVM